MSLKTVLQKIGKFFENIWLHLKPELKFAVKIGLEITNAIKNFDTAHPEVGDILTKIIPGTLDDKGLIRMREELPKIVVELQLVDAQLNLTDNNEIMMAALDTIRRLTGRARNTVLNSLSQLIAQVQADGKLDWNDVAYLQKWLYDHIDNPNVNTNI
jgi:hypothetical protein